MNIADIDVHINHREEGDAWRCREAKVDNGNAGETIVDAKVAFGPINGKEGRGNQKRRDAPRPIIFEGDTRRRF